MNEQELESEIQELNELVGELYKHLSVKGKIILNKRFSEERKRALEETKQFLKEIINDLL